MYTLKAGLNHGTKKAKAVSQIPSMWQGKGQFLSGTGLLILLFLKSSRARGWVTFLIISWALEQIRYTINTNVGGRLLVQVIDGIII